MESLNRLPSIIASLADTVGHCINALKGGGDVAQVVNCLTTIKQALAKLRPVINTLVEVEEQQSLALFATNDAAIELLLSLDSTQPSYAPRPHDENIDLIHSILEWYPDVLPPDNVVNMPVKKEVN